MRRNVVVPILAALSTALAVTASLYISVFWEPGREEILDAPGFLVFYFFPVLISLGGLQASRYPTRAGKAWLTIAAILLLYFCFVALFTIGIFFFPALVPLAVAAVGAHCPGKVRLRSVRRTRFFASRTGPSGRSE